MKLARALSSWQSMKVQLELSRNWLPARLQPRNSTVDMICVCTAPTLPCQVPPVTSRKLVTRPPSSTPNLHEVHVHCSKKVEAEKDCIEQSLHAQFEKLAPPKTVAPSKQQLSNTRPVVVTPKKESCWCEKSLLLKVVTWD